MAASGRLIDLGDLALTLPMAAALVAALLASHAWRMALWWGLLFAACISLVGASKIAFLGWGGGWQAACFKALSGHAAGVTAVFPMLFYLLCQQWGKAARRLALVAGLALGALVAVWLVALHHHSSSEAVAGWLAGAAVTMLALRLGGELPPLHAVPAFGAAAMVYAILAWLMQSAPVGYWMILAARYLSGNRHLFSLSVSS